MFPVAKLVQKSSQVGLKWSQVRPVDPKLAQVGPKLFQVVFKAAQVRPQFEQVDSSMAPGGSKLALRRP